MTAQPNAHATPPAAASALHAPVSPTTTRLRPTIASLPSTARTRTFTVPAAPERVFPLLCPVLEYDWIPTWRADILHTTSGVAEEDCIFRTAHAGATPMTWVVSRYEPPARIEFTCFVPDHFVFRLKIALRPVDGGTEMTWTRRWLATTPNDPVYAEASAEAQFDERMTALERLLVHYLRTGEMLHP